MKLKKEHVLEMRNIINEMTRKRLEKIKSRNGWSETDLIKHANNPKNYRRKHK